MVRSPNVTSLEHCAICEVWTDVNVMEYLWFFSFMSVSGMTHWCIRLRFQSIINLSKNVQTIFCTIFISQWEIRIVPFSRRTPQKCRQNYCRMPLEWNRIQITDAHWTRQYERWTVNVQSTNHLDVTCEKIVMNRLHILFVRKTFTIPKFSGRHCWEFHQPIIFFNGSLSSSELIKLDYLKWMPILIHLKFIWIRIKIESFSWNCIRLFAEQLEKRKPEIAYDSA